MATIYSGDEECGDEITSPEGVEVVPCRQCGEDAAGERFCSEGCRDAYFAEVKGDDDYDREIDGE